MDFELISFKLCPFVQRAAIILLFKKIPFRTSYIDLANPPDWFRAISPFGKVPVLRLDETTVLFESSVIIMPYFPSGLYETGMFNPSPHGRVHDGS